MARDPAARSSLEVVLFYPGFHARPRPSPLTQCTRRRPARPARTHALPRASSRASRFIPVRSSAHACSRSRHRRGHRRNSGDRRRRHRLPGRHASRYQHAAHQAPSHPARPRHRRRRREGHRSGGDRRKRRIGAGSVVVTNVPPTPPSSAYPATSSPFTMIRTAPFNAYRTPSGNGSTTSTAR